MVRYGPPGREQPGLIDGAGILRNLSGLLGDLCGDSLHPRALRQIAALDPDTLPEVAGSPRFGPCVAGTGKFIGIGLNYSDHAAEAGLKVPGEPIVFMKATSAISGPNDPIEIPQVIPARLG